MTSRPASQQADLSSIPADEEIINALLANHTRVGQIIKPTILECSPHTSLQEAAQRMSNMKVSSILVVDDDQVLGIWTERDVLKLDFSRPQLLQMPVSRVMSSPVRTVPASLTLQELAIRFSDERLRHYVVVDEQGNRCGMVSQTDVVINQGIEHYLKLRSIDTVVHRGLQFVTEDAGLSEVASLMRTAGVDAVAVECSDGIWGIITERDIVRHIAGQAGRVRAGDIASKPMITVSDQSSLYRVRNMLIENRLRHIGVTHPDHGLIGIVSFRDILSSMELTYVQELQQALRERDEALSISQRNLRLAEQVIESSLEGIMVTDLNSTIISVNPAFTRLTGYRAQEVVGKTPAVLSSGRHDKNFYQAMWQQVNQHGHWQGEVWNRRKNGEIYPEFLTITAIGNKDGEPTHYAALFSDITELKENEERIRQLAYYDALTGLPNRRLLEDRLSVATSHAQRHNQQLALLFIDLDRFKRINDSLGHDIGDQLLSSIAARLCTAVRPHDTIARMGGDEFVALLTDLNSPAQAVQIARRMLDLLQEPVNIQGHDLVVTTSIGISIFPTDGEDSISLLRNADAAMYRAKGSGRNAIQMYTAAMNARSLENLALENALHQALEKQQFELYYQPIVDARTGRMYAAEALLRWNHGDMGVISPADFLSIAEETSLIVHISDWVVETGCMQLAHWNTNGYPGLRMSINMATRHFYKQDFQPFMQRMLAQSGCSPANLTLELTEHMLMDDAQKTSARLNAMHDLGLHIGLDDFGTGFSSLTHLRSFPLDVLKIDREFVRNLNDPASRETAIIESVIGMAHKLGLRVVAEGVETLEQIQHLQAFGCELLQGYYFSPPVPAHEFEQLLAQGPFLYR